MIPVYGGAQTLAGTVDEIVALTGRSITPDGHEFTVAEIILVDDNGPDDSGTVIRRIAADNDIVKAVWLSRNFGQHAATLAGISASTGDWVVTMDEDGQHDPSAIGVLLDAAFANSARVVYARPLNPPPHGVLRNFASRAAKSVIVQLAGNPSATDFNSFRLILASVARSVSEYAGPGVYLDVALGWMVGRYATAGVTLRQESRESGYSVRSLASHFWRMVISSGTRVLRLVSIAGVALGAIGVVFAVWIVFVKIALGIDSEGWASIMVVLLLGFGAVLVALGVIAEFIGATLDAAMGKPLFIITEDPALGPLGQQVER